ncbi:hypothetical protein CI109_104802 [Kwoniella shandongensis]|uniref:Uncharacterized protein n=1 Tax=Kwoniella shandongensis TaxID=1734106 RepID=A0A5M6BPH0_9TREE|nr:uncharacterized protein CI109_006886 [Kwoniella shandongensis]KAA5524798.1 hypothetical protein CI109_006886 [Kwoniella shandongensis]
MLHGSSPAPPGPSPASLFIQRLNAPVRYNSYDSTFDDGSSPSSVAGLGLGKPDGGEGSAGGDVRRTTSLRAAGPFGGLQHRKEVVSFAAAGSDLSSSSTVFPTTAQAGPSYTPPAASRHPLFSHHASPPGTVVLPPAPSLSSITTSGIPSPSFLSDPGPSVPSSPTAVSDVSSSAFSPASAFLSHFSSSTSLRGPSNVAPDAQGARVLDYTLGKLVGRGGFSTVRKAIHITTGEVLACKIVKRDDLSDRSGSLEKFEDEIRIWKGLPRHPSLLPLMDMHRTPFATFLITPYLPGGSLLDVLRREGGSDKTARKWFPGVVAAVAALHEGFRGFDGGVLHGDLKLDNFLVDHIGGVMVCDFYMAQKVDGKLEDRHAHATIPPPLNSGNSGNNNNNGVSRHATLPTHLHRGPRMSSPFPNSHAHSYKPNEHAIHDANSLPAQPFPSASLPYAPPELLRAPPSGPSLAQDIWAVGIILHALLTGRLPFVDAFDPRLQMKILRGTWDAPPDLGREWMECLFGCLDGNKDSRWNIQRVRESDAVLGWTEVKSRAKSRSRSRARLPLGEGLAETRPRRRSNLGPDNGAMPLPILSPTYRSRKHSSGDRSAYSPGGIPNSPRDVFAPLSPTTQKVETRQSRSQSVSASRSRSSGNGHRQMFAFDAPDLVKSLENVNVDVSRGRSTRRDNSSNSGLSVPGYSGRENIDTPSPGPGLTYARQSSSIAMEGLPIPIPGYSSSRSRSTSQSAHRGMPQSAPTHSTFRPMALQVHGFKPISTTTSTTTSASPSPSQSRSRSGTSPSVSRGPRSVSRHGRNAATADQMMSPPSLDEDDSGSGRGRGGGMLLDIPGSRERYEYGRELGAVHEEDRGRTGRSRSRGRKGRGG